MISAIIEGWKYKQQGIEIDLGTITSGNFSETVKVIGCEEATVFITVTGGTFTNVVFRLRHSLDDSNWFNTNSQNEDFTVTEAGKYALRYDGCKSTNYLQLQVVSSVAESAPTITAKLKLG